MCAARDLHVTLDGHSSRQVFREGEGVGQSRCTLMIDHTDSMIDSSGRVVAAPGLPVSKTGMRQKFGRVFLEQNTRF